MFKQTGPEQKGHLRLRVHPEPEFLPIVWSSCLKVVCLG